MRSNVTKARRRDGADTVPFAAANKRCVSEAMNCLVAVRTQARRRSRAVSAAAHDGMRRAWECRQVDGDIGDEVMARRG